MAQVSEYGSTKPAEFVGEVLSAMLEGKTYSPEVLRIYKRYGGPSYPGLVDYTPEEIKKLIQLHGSDYLDTQ